MNNYDIPFMVRGDKPEPVAAFLIDPSTGLPVSPSAGSSGGSASVPTGAATVSGSVPMDLATDSTVRAAIGTTADAQSDTGNGSTIALLKSLRAKLAAALSVIPQVSGTAVSSSNPLPIRQPDTRATGAALSLTATTSTVAIALDGGEGVVGFTVTGLTGKGAVLTAEASNDGGTTWSAINTTAPGTGALSQTVTVDGQFRINAGGHTNVRLRVSTAGTGSATVATSASSADTLTALSAPLPTGANLIGATTPQLTACGHLSVATATSSGATFTAFAAQACKQVTIANNTSATVEVQQGAAGVAFPVFPGSYMTFFGLTDISQLGVRRVDQSTTSVTVQARWES